MLAPVGEAIAREVLERFVREDLIGYARAIRTPAVATSGIGALLSYGLLSAREVVQSVRLRVEDPFILAEERASTELFLRAMARRDFYLLGAAANEERAPEEALFSATHAGFEAWTQGRTGFPLVDAGMRELRATGSMHPAVRAVAASFCCFDLGVDWRRGMEAWEEHLVEDEPALAAGNWRTSAGLAADLHFPRIYDPQRQFLRTDPQARYVRRWVPELGLLTDARQLRTERGAQGTLDLFQTQRYPAPILDHKERARNFLARYAQVRATALQAAGR